MRSLLTPLWLGLMLLCLDACSRPATLKVTVTGVPMQSISLAVSLALQSETDGSIQPMQGLAPYELPQPVAGQTSFVLRLPLAGDATLLLGVAAFSQPGGSGCVLGLGSMSHPFSTAILDDELKVVLSPYSQDARSGCPGSARIVVAGPSALTAAGGETLQVLGWGFVPAARIVLNGVPLATRYVSAGLLEATTPPSARLMPVPLSVERPGGEHLSYQGLRYTAKTLAFTPLTTFSVPDSYHQVEIADLDGDQRPDLLFFPTAYTSDNHVSIAFQRAPLQFTVEPLALIGDVDGVVVVDLDRDGDLDLVAASSDRQTLKLLYNDGRGAFVRKTLPLAATATVVRCVDLDGDGAPEVVFLDDGFGSNQVLYALPNDGKGSFDPQLATRTKLTQTSGAFALVGLDYDLDGKIDLLPIDDSQFTVLLNRGGGLPPDDSAAPLVQFNDSISTFMSVADLDGDQIPDLLASDLGDIPMVFLSRSTPPRTRQGLRPACPSAVYAAADLDGDGLPDTAFGCSYKNEIRFQRQLPSHLLVASTQAPPVIYSVEDPFLYALKLADLDADGRPELIFGITPNSSAGSTDYYVYHNVSQ